MHAWLLDKVAGSNASAPIANSTASIVENAFHKGKPIKNSAYWQLHGTDSEPQPQTGPRAYDEIDKCINPV